MLKKEKTEFGSNGWRMYGEIKDDSFWEIWKPNKALLKSGGLTVTKLGKRYFYSIGATSEDLLLEKIENLDDLFDLFSDSVEEGSEISESQAIIDLEHRISELRQTDSRGTVEGSRAVTPFILGSYVRIASDPSASLYKVHSIDEDRKGLRLSQFLSIDNPDFVAVEVLFSEVQSTIIPHGTEICARRGEVWLIGTYEMERNDGHALFIFGQEELLIVPQDDSNTDFWVIENNANEEINPFDYLAKRCVTPAKLAMSRFHFIKSYNKQKSVSLAIPSILSSSIDIVPHQIAVAKTVIDDDHQKYLLADEVGLGKTIEAGLIIRNHLLSGDNDRRVIVLSPSHLVSQWRTELENRFFLKLAIDDRLLIVPHESIRQVEERLSDDCSMIVIDEAHLLSHWAWSVNEKDKKSFAKLARLTKNTDAVLLLSGTQSTGNEINYLAMLHLLSPEKFTLDDKGIEKFFKLVADREKIAGNYQSLKSTTPNSRLIRIIKQTKESFPDDTSWAQLCDKSLPILEEESLLEGSVELRDQAIRNMRKYLGENYRLHQRMLRNRRQDADISFLFPGLGDLRVINWPIESQQVSVEQSLDYLRESREFSVEGQDFMRWLELYFTNPILLAQHFQIDEENKSITDKSFLQDLVFRCEQEQNAKDEILIQFIDERLQASLHEKIIIFCGETHSSIRLTDILKEHFDEKVERHVGDESVLAFSAGPTVRILVCDEKGEDGLNLHGGSRMLVHYSMPVDFNRLEQRNGRANRFSANQTAQPVQSLILCPDYEYGYLTAWISMLDEGLNIFGESVARLQHILTDKMREVWRQTAIKGVDAVETFTDELKGENGLVAQESKKIAMQEMFNAKQDEVAAVTDYAKNLELLEEDLENPQGNYQRSTKYMSEWVKQGLKFRRRKGELKDTFRFQYQSEVTLMPKDQFLELCWLSIETGRSDGNIVTTLLSPSRNTVSKGNNVHPVRYGQPFVDAVYNYTVGIVRGTTAMWMRRIPRNIARPGLYFHCTWTSKASKTALSIYRWFDQNGEVVSDAMALSQLTLKYTPSGAMHNDSEVPKELWPSLEKHFGRDWKDLVKGVEDASRNFGERDLELTVGYPDSVYAVLILGV